MSETHTPNPNPGGSVSGVEGEATRRQREAVERLLAREVALSEGSITFGHAALDYEVQAAFLPVMGTGLSDAGAEPQAAVLATAYLRKGVPAASRPVCFAFNGGPGSASLWLHLGALGPKRVVIQDDGHAPAPPYGVVDNPQSWLAHFDLVCLDPPHTGLEAA